MYIQQRTPNQLLTPIQWYFFALALSKRNQRSSDRAAQLITLLAFYFFWKTKHIHGAAKKDKQNMPLSSCVSFWMKEKQSISEFKQSALREQFAVGWTMSTFSHSYINLCRCRKNVYTGPSRPALSFGIDKQIILCLQFCQQSREKTLNLSVWIFWKGKTIIVWSDGPCLYKILSIYSSWRARVCVSFWAMGHDSERTERNGNSFSWPQISAWVTD